MYAGSDSNISVEGADRSAASVFDNDDQRLATPRLLTGVTKACYHYAIAEETFARRRRDEELLSSVEIDVHLQSRRPSRATSSRI